MAPSVGTKRVLQHCSPEGQNAFSGFEKFQELRTENVSNENASYRKQTVVDVYNDDVSTDDARWSTLRRAGPSDDVARSTSFVVNRTLGLLGAVGLPCGRPRRLPHHRSLHYLVRYPGCHHVRPVR